MAERAVTLMKQQFNELDVHPDLQVTVPMHCYLFKQQNNAVRELDVRHYEGRLRKLRLFLMNLAPGSVVFKQVERAVAALVANQETALQRHGRDLKQKVTKRYGELLQSKFKKRAKVDRSVQEPIQMQTHDPINLYRQMVKKQIPKAAKQMAQSSVARLGNLKKIALLSQREARKVDMREVRALKEAGNRAKRLMREQLAFWKKNEREERELRKRAEKEANERKRQEEEQREARRQAKKLNFLITQTELYSHFIARKSNLPAGTSNQQQHISIDEDFADIDDEVLRKEAERRAMEMASKHQMKVNSFDQESDMKRQESMIDSLNFQNPTLLEGQTELTQPELLRCQLKSYQLKGLTWLANLYEQGINGILADEMGLGKTVQSISLMAHLAERQSNWGPFLVIAPASTLHNWQQELAKFVPSFRILPYWGSVRDRAVLRKFWNPKKLYQRDSPFHVLITSYQLIVSDEKYFQKLKWQYMILDEAQAIKSSSSIRWKTLLSFDCRNRLLLTGTPIQNSMQELWALLHFIMPGLFDSHDEFSEWFSKDIENAAQSASSGGNNPKGFNEHQLQRLHLILKPFMLRRVKKDVENELGEKIEKDIYCELSERQKRLYRGIKEKIPIAELLEKAQLEDSSSSSLMNLVMQFRKVCNHPELFERSELSSSWVMHASGQIGPECPRDENVIWIAPLTNPININVPYLELDVPRVPFIVFPDYSSITSICSNPVVIELAPSTYDSLLCYKEPVLAKPIFESGVKTNQNDLGCNVYIPSMKKLLTDSAKLMKLDELLRELKTGGHRVLIYNQMTRMIDLMEEYLQYRHYSYLRLDGSSRIADRRDLVSDWQSRPDIFIFLLSTRAGGLGINLTAADTVIFYDSDWNPTVDQQAMDRAHRLGQTKQVTVYRLITKGTVEERIRQKAAEKDAIHKMVIAGGEFKPVMGMGEKPKDRDLAMLLLD